MSTRTLHLHIDRIVVDGLSPSAGHRFASALEQRLTRMAAEGMPQALAPATRKISSIDAGRMRSGASADQAAAQVVQSIQQRLSGAKGEHHG